MRREYLKCDRCDDTKWKYESTGEIPTLGVCESREWRRGRCGTVAWRRAEMEGGKKVRKKAQLKVKNKKCVPHKNNDNDNVKKILNDNKTHLFH